MTDVTAEDFGLLENENENKICLPPFEVVKDFSVRNPNWIGYWAGYKTEGDATINVRAARRLRIYGEYNY